MFHFYFQSFEKSRDVETNKLVYSGYNRQESINERR